MLEGDKCYRIKTKLAIERIIFNKIVKVGFIEKVTSEQRLEEVVGSGPCWQCVKKIPGSGNCQ